MANIRFLRHVPPYMPGDVTVVKDEAELVRLVDTGLAELLPEEKSKTVEKGEKGNGGAR